VVQAERRSASFGEGMVGGFEVGLVGLRLVCGWVRWCGGGVLLRCEGGLERRDRIYKYCLGVGQVSEVGGVERE